MRSPRAVLRDARYALPGLIERHVPGPDAAAAARLCRRLHARGLATTSGYFQAARADPATIAAANIALIRALGGAGGMAGLSLKAPPLRFDSGLIGEIGKEARRAGLPVVLDAHAPADAEATHALLDCLLGLGGETGIVLPARWRRTADDAARLRDTPASIRLVKGEWADPAFPEGEIEAGYVALARQLAGRAAPVLIATHKPELAEAALAPLVAAGTPCTLEQLRGLPGRRTMAIARRLRVPVRVYVPFGPGWWPYAIDKALARPYLPRWFLSDLLARSSRQAAPISA